MTPNDALDPLMDYLDRTTGQQVKALRWDGTPRQLEALAELGIVEPPAAGDYLVVMETFGGCIWCSRLQPIAADAPGWHVITLEDTGYSCRRECTRKSQVAVLAFSPAEFERNGRFEFVGMGETHGA